MKTQRLLRTGGILIFLLLFFVFEIPDVVAYSNSSGEKRHNAINQELIRNNQPFGSEINTEANITRVEYFFDVDPGFGNGTPIEISPGSEIEIEKVIPVNSLTEGIHIFYLRACDDLGKWSQTLNRLFLKTQLQSDDPYNITRVEYFFDTDPGIGKATAAEFTLNNNIIVDNNWSENMLDNGIHILYVRALDEIGQWSLTYHRLFLKTQLKSDIVNIQEVEYFFDTDPGNGNGTKIDIQPGEQITIDQILPIEELNYGLHSVNIRGKFSNDNWGQIFHRSFIKYPSYDVVKAEYYFDTDPGLGNATALSISPSETIIIDELLDIQTLTLGNHTFNVRAMSENNKWSNLYSSTITIILTGNSNIPNGKAFVNVYPNPTQGRLNIETNNLIEPLDIQLISPSGSVLQNRKHFVESTTTLDLSSLTNGIYILRFLYNDEVKTQNIILNK